MIRNLICPLVIRKRL